MVLKSRVASLTLLIAPDGAMLDTHSARDPPAAAAAELTRPFEPALPVELVLLVLEAAAAASKPAAATLSLLSRAARAVALPHLFRTLVLHKRNYAYALARFLRRTPHVAAHVRALWMRESTGADSALLALCPRLAHVACLPACLAQFCALGRLQAGAHAAAPTRPSPTPAQLVLLPGHCDWLDFDTRAPFTRAYLAGLTHLWLTQPAQLHALVQRRCVLAAMSGLTHLAVPWYGSTSIPADIFSLLPSLRALVLVVLPKPPSGPTLHGPRGHGLDPDRAGRRESAGFPLDKRMRLYAFLDDAIDSSVFPLWMQQCSGGRSIWDVAVKILRPS